MEPSTETEVPETKFKWDALESNPEVFNAYLTKVGLLSNWNIGEVYGFDEELLSFLPQPIKAVIVAIRSGPNGKDFDWTSIGTIDAAASKWFMKQTGNLDNACGIIAAIHGIFNTLDLDSDLEADSVLRKFYNDAEGADAY